MADIYLELLVQLIILNVCDHFPSRGVNVWMAMNTEDLNSRNYSSNTWFGTSQASRNAIWSFRIF